MTQIEDMLRATLAETPTAGTTTDPLTALDRRVRRARRRLAVGAGIGAVALAAAVVVPLSVLGSADAGRLQVATPPTPTATATSSPGLTLETSDVLWTNGAVWFSVTRDGQRWLLYNDDSGPGDRTFVGRQRTDGTIAEHIVVPTTSSYVIATAQAIWVVSGAGASDGYVTAIDLADGSVHEQPTPSEVISYTAVQGESFYAVANRDSGTVVERRRIGPNGGIEVVSTTPVPHAEELVATDDGRLWAHADKQLVELKPTADGVTVGVSVRWGSGQLLGAPVVSDGAEPGSGALWADDGRVIGLMPLMLQQGTSVAEGLRVGVDGRPGAAVSTPDGGLFVSIVEPGSDGIGIAYYSPAALRDDNTPVTARLVGPQVIEMSLDPSGGVDYVDDAGTLSHWQPTGSDASR